MNVNKLPTEILQQILKRVAMGPEQNMATAAPALRRHLLGVCFRWREIILNMAELWTFVRIYLIKTEYEGKETTFQNALATLDLNLSRTSSQLLDIYWHTSLDGSHVTQLFKVINTRAPFCRWRSLEIDTDFWHSYKLHSIRSDDRFSNLESLKIRWCQREGLLLLINSTISSNFRSFHNIGAYTPADLLRDRISNIMSRATELTLPNFGAALLPPLPPQITTLSIWSMTLQSTAHIRHLTIHLSPSISQFFDHDWSSLISLDVLFTRTQQSHPLPQQTILFPRLQTLVVREGRFRSLISISAPSLVSLRLERGHESIEKANRSLFDTISHPSYTVKSMGKLEIGFPLSPMVLASVIRDFPAVESLGFGFDDSYDGWEVIRHVICERRYVKVEWSERLKDNFMAGVKILKLQMNWILGDDVFENPWKAYTAKIFEDIPGKQLETIRCSWPRGDSWELTRLNWEKSHSKVDGSKQEEGHCAL
ncbi:hypothetical protein FRB91_004485 [Serendipita sp. 411]|nr:hypothetical protein FRB91_004485 [Serendipita sp. 411]